MINDNERRMNEKCDFFSAEKIAVHIKKHDKEFLNGILKKKLREGVWLLDERKLGDVYVFVKDIYEIVELKEVQE